jgi:hypothetical protein
MGCYFRRTYTYKVTFYVCFTALYLRLSVKRLVKDVCSSSEGFKLASVMRHSLSHYQAPAR